MRIPQLQCALHLQVLIHARGRQGHYNRALEEAISSHKSQWPKDWEGQNPVSGSSTFASLGPKERVCPNALPHAQFLHFPARNSRSLRPFS